MTKKQYKITSTNRIVIEPVPDFLRLLECFGTNEKGEDIKVYIYRVEKISEDKKTRDKN